jgi:hypothetical protein
MYQVYLYGPETITYLNANLRQPAPPTLYDSITFTHLKENSTMAKLLYIF